MNIAQQVENKINQHYNGSMNYADLANYLKNNQIDRNEILSNITHHGFDKPYEEQYPMIIYYEDNSLLVITGYQIFSAMKT